MTNPDNPKLNQDVDVDALQRATELATSQRGHLLIGKAIYTYLQVLAELPENRMPHSDMNDLECMLTNIFPVGAVAAVLEDPRNRESGKLKSVMELLCAGMTDEERAEITAEVASCVGLEQSTPEEKTEDN